MYFAVSSRYEKTCNPYYSAFIRYKIDQLVWHRSHLIRIQAINPSCPASLLIDSLIVCNAYVHIALC